MNPTEEQTRARRDLEKQRLAARQDSDALASGKAAFRRIMGRNHRVEEWMRIATKAADQIVDDCNAAIRELESDCP